MGLMVPPEDRNDAQTLAYPGLDVEANQALEDIGPDAAAAIMEQLEAEGSKVRNPSAYVVKAVGNARRGKGAGGAIGAARQAASQVVVPHTEPEEGFAQEPDLDAVRDSLDAKAIEALDS